jgi:hypothetical protein
MWGKNGRSIYYADRDGAENLYAHDLTAGRKMRITRFTTG